MNKWIIGLLLALFSLFAKGEERHLLEQCTTFERLPNAIRWNQEWVDYPAYHDRKAWDERVDDSMRKLIIRRGEKALKHQWKPDLASDYLAFKRTGEIRTGRDNHRALQALMLAELVEGKQRFMEAIVDGAWFLCETAWIHSAHLAFQNDQSGLPDRDEPTIELVVADIGAQMAWLHYFFKEELDSISPLIDRRIVEEVKGRLINPYFARDDYWWMGFSGKQVNNWNPWINFNVLQALMLVEEDKERVCQGVWKLMRSTDYFFSMYHEDGACDEGPTYWSGASGYALKFLDLLDRVTGGVVNIFQHPMLHRMAQYIYRVHIGDNLFVNFADSSPKVTPSPGTLYQFGKRIGDRQMMEFASFVARSNRSFDKGVSGFFAASLDELLMYTELKDYPQSAPLPADYWWPDTQICIARDKAGSDKGFFFAAKGGHNQESHNHNDVGSCVLYYNKEPLLIDVGVGTYTRQTFGPERYTIWTMRSAYHNLPLINGMEQKNGKEFAARGQQFTASSGKVEYRVDIAGAYPQEAGVEHWWRRYTLHRGKRFEIADSWEFAVASEPHVLNLMTCCQVETDDKGRVYLQGDSIRFQLLYDKQAYRIETDAIPLTDAKLTKSWDGKTLTRIRLVANYPMARAQTRMTLQPCLSALLGGCRFVRPVPR